MFKEITEHIIVTHRKSNGRWVADTNDPWIHVSGNTVKCKESQAKASSWKQDQYIDISLHPPCISRPETSWEKASRSLDTERISLISPKDVKTAWQEACL